MQANKMKVLFLTLVLGLVCSSQEIPAEPHHSEISGEWRIHYIASSNTEKTGENGPFNVYLRSIKFDDIGDSLVFHFFVKNNGECIESSVSGRRIANNVYVAEYAGANEFHFILVSDDGLIVNTENVDETGNRTRLIGLLGKEDDVDDHDLERFLEEVRKLGIPEENIVDFTKGDGCQAQ
ncbi:odorant-binding protein-like [Budorcas taxicolor]|uniref:odorant-binding protein-like n=1 Tax=Budorcas taxicolor TaxID=37181 RepID=UPI00228384D9|nr:odorant-binding protein-like [Budorcas taxicolor]